MYIVLHFFYMSLPIKCMGVCAILKQYYRYVHNMY